jgi:hypothetical protein
MRLGVGAVGLCWLMYCWLDEVEGSIMLCSHGWLAACAHSAALPGVVLLMKTA